jgi:hypothetical protein
VIGQQRPQHLTSDVDEAIVYHSLGERYEQEGDPTFALGASRLEFVGVERTF